MKFQKIAVALAALLTISKAQTETADDPDVDAVDPLGEEGLVFLRGELSGCSPQACWDEACDACQGGCLRCKKGSSTYKYCGTPYKDWSAAEYGEANYLC